MKREFTNKRVVLMSTVASVALLSLVKPASAFDYLSNGGVDIRLDNTLEYSVIQRTSAESSHYAQNPNANDGDNNLRAGIVSNKFDLISTFDMSYQNFGIDVSAESFYDTVYNQKTQNKSGATYNPARTQYDKFSTATIAQAGRNIELRNLFAYGAGNIGGIPVSLKVGRLVNIFGESLFMASQGIAYGQAPINAVLASSVPNTQSKNLFLPVGQALLTTNLTDSVSVSAYYQFEWEKLNSNPVGDFFSYSDLYDAGGQRYYLRQISPYVSPAQPGAAGYLYRANDLKGASTGQFGIAMHYDPIGSNWDYGFYALQYNDSEPQLYAELKAGPPTVVPNTAKGSPVAESFGSYQAVYANGIQIYGVSASTTIGPVNFAGEASVRANEDLTSVVTLLPGQTAGNHEHNAAYAIGDVGHYLVNAVYAGPKIPGVWDASSTSFEIGAENLFAISKNKAAFDATGLQHVALGFRGVESITYFEVLPGLDITPSFGLGWNFMGKAPDGVFNGGEDRGGDISLGVSYTYLNKWSGGVRYSEVLAPPGRAANADRAFVSFSVQRTF